MCAPDWTEQEFETLLQHNKLSAEALARLLPRRTSGGVAAVRAAICAHHKGDEKFKVSKMMVQRLKDRSHPVTCPTCGERVPPLTGR